MNPSHMYVKVPKCISSPSSYALLNTQLSAFPIYVVSWIVFLATAITNLNTAKQELLHAIHCCTDLQFSTHLLTHQELTQPSTIAMSGHLKVAGVRNHCVRSVQRRISSSACIFSMSTCHFFSGLLDHFRHPDQGLLNVEALQGLLHLPVLPL